MSSSSYFEIRVAKDTFKFNAAHFVAYKGYRERLHGHNYSVSVKLIGSRKIGPDGYVLDFGCVKDVTKKICKELNEHFICPMLSDVLTITMETHKISNGQDTNNNNNNNGNDEEDDNEEYISIICEDGSKFLFPKNDCMMLPIVHATAEELAIYLYGKILQSLDACYLLKRGIHTMEVVVAEAIGQEALFRLEIPKDKENRHVVFDVQSYIINGDIVPMPCLLPQSEEGLNVLKIKRNKSDSDISNVATNTTKQHHYNKKEEKGCNCNDCKSQFSAKLQALADAINSGKLNISSKSNNDLSVKDLEEII